MTCWIVLGVGGLGSLHSSSVNLITGIRWHLLAKAGI